MATEHTPGSWHFNSKGAETDDGAMSGWILEAGAVDDEPCIAYIDSVGSADLALMLAAPELLAMAQAFVVASDHNSDTGECDCDGDCDAAIDLWVGVDRMARTAIRKARGGGQHVGTERYAESIRDQYDNVRVQVFNGDDGLKRED